jgi:hypothetical protein
MEKYPMLNNKIKIYMKTVKLLALSIVAAFSSLTAGAEDCLSISTATLNTDNSPVVELALTNANSQACAFQCDVVFPEGVTPSTTLTSTSRINGHAVGAAVQKDGSLRVLVYSVNNNAFSGNSGAPVVQIPVDMTGVAAGTVTFKVTNQEISYYDASAESNRVSYIRPSDVSTDLTVTAIESVKADSEEGASTVYTIDGKKVKDAKKAGVYIKNGKKVLVK